MSNDAATVDVDRDAVNAVLEKLGVEKPEEFVTERAMAKLRNRLTKRGVPAGLEPAERAVVEGLGFTVPAEPPPAAPPAKGAKQKYRLPGIPGVSADRIEELTPELVAMRNNNRKDNRRWEPVADDAEPAADNTAATPKEHDVSTATVPKGTTKTKAAAPGRDRGGAKSKANPDAGAPKAAKSRSGAAAQVFRDAFTEVGKPVDKAKLIEKLVKAGAKEGTAHAYVVWAKRPVSRGKDKNPFGFRISESKDDKGNKILRREKKGN